MPEDTPVATPTGNVPAPKAGGGRGRCLARLGLMLLSPLLFLLLLEGALRLAGVGYPTTYWVHNEGGEGLATNLRFGWRYFPPRVARWPRPQVVQAEKPADSLRVLVLGESAAFGTPSELYGFQRIMQLQLEAQFPNRPVEVVNGAMTAINSHTILAIAKDSVRQIQPDWVVIYMGNNEVVGPYGSGSVFGSFTRSRALIHATLALQSTAIAQGFNRLTDPAGTQGGKFEEWQGMANFTEQQVPAWDPRMPVIYDHFRENLREIIALSQAGGAQVLVCTVPVNLRDCPPFGSMPGPDHEPAETVWREASAQQTPELLARARDLDTLRFRCDSSMQRIIREAAAEYTATLLDLEAIANASAPGLVKAAGNEIFYEHVHLNFHGNYLVGSNIAAALAQVERGDHEFQAPATLQETTPPLTEEQCAKALAYTPLEQVRVEGSMVEGLLAQPPFTLQWQHEARYAQTLAAWNEKKQRLLTTENVADSIVAANAALRARQQDLHLRESVLQHYTRMSDGTPRAMQEASYILKILPGNYLVRTELAGMYLKSGDTEAAIREYRLALKANPYYNVARKNLEIATEASPP